MSILSKYNIQLHRNTPANGSLMLCGMSSTSQKVRNDPPRRELLKAFTSLAHLQPCLDSDKEHFKHFI